MISAFTIQCSICLEEINKDYSSSVIPCAHKFCFNCISKWISQKITCPLCKKPITSITKTTPDSIETIKIEEPSPLIKEDSVHLEEDFDCLDHSFFIEEYQSILSILSKLEFELRAGKYIKDSEKLVSAFTLILDLKKDIKTKIQTLSKKNHFHPMNQLSDLDEARKLCLQVKIDIENQNIKILKNDENFCMSDVIKISKMKKQSKAKFF